MNIDNLRRTFVAGHNGMVGRAICRNLANDSSVELIVENRSELDLTCSDAVLEFFRKHDIDEVYLAAAKVGGIHANNTYPVDFMYSNLSIELNVLNAAHQTGVGKVLFLGSSCIYPRDAVQPMTEEQLLSGPLEPTNEPYAIAKIAGIKLCESYRRQYGSDFRSVMPTNLYGPWDNFHPQNSHVVPALIQRFRQAVEKNAEELVVWGSGKPMREFLHVDDMASACVHVMQLSKQTYDAAVTERCSHLNVGTGIDCTIRELAENLADISGFSGKLVFDDTKPDGTPRKLLDVSKLHALGWRHSIELPEGLRDAFDWYVRNTDKLRAD